MERQLDQQMDKLRTRIIKMCSLVDEQIELAVRTIEEENEELANLIIDREKRVDKYDLKIDKACQKIFALNHPVAMDLRLLMSSLTINSNLEKIGDGAMALAQIYLTVGKKPPFYNRIKFREMAAVMKGMIQNAIDSFIEMDAKLAAKVIETDKQLDILNTENDKLLVDIMKEDREQIDAAVAYLLMAQQIERLGDLATNIAEDIYFVVEAQIIKHNYEKYIFGDDGDDDEMD
jgi:phosphate transport system protein